MVWTALAPRAPTWVVTVWISWVPGSVCDVVGVGGGGGGGGGRGGVRRGRLAMTTQYNDNHKKTKLTSYSTV